MNETAQLHPTYKALMPYVVALFGIKQEGPKRQAVLHKGSGTLITINGIFGILTAGHVIQALEPFETWAYASFNGTGGYSRMHSFSRQDSERLGDDYENTDGPDIGFIQLPTHVSSLPPDETIFYNITQRYNEAKIKNNNNIVDLPIRVVAGVIGESSEITDQSNNSTEVKTTMLVATAIIIHKHERNDMDYYTVRVGKTDGLPHSTSYQGVSGGPIFATKENASSALERMLIGVAFKQSNQDESGNRTILCHGFNSIYHCLCPIITMRYADQSTLDKLLALSSTEDNDKPDQ